MSALIGAGLLLLLFGDGAAAECKCRARGVVAAEGQTLCIWTPEGTRLARCGKVSNVASWTFLEGPCPQAAIEMRGPGGGEPYPQTSPKPR